MLFMCHAKLRTGWEVSLGTRAGWRSLWVGVGMRAGWRSLCQVNGVKRNCYEVKPRSLSCHVTETIGMYEVNLTDISYEC